jgi:hypothetical protein
MLQEVRWCEGVVATNWEGKSCVSKDAEDEDRGGLLRQSSKLSLLPTSLFLM